MLNYLWAGMVAAGICWAAFHGNMAEVTNGILDSSKEAVALSITMLGIMSFWSGILKVGENAGLVEQMTRQMRPVIRFLFPRLPGEHPAAASISTNMIANILGLGWAATPAGLKAMKELAELEEERREEESREKRNTIEMDSGGQSRRRKRTVGRTVGMPKGVASNEMCTFLIINISSLQLIPVNMIAYRSQYGSVNPAAVIAPAIAATLFSTIVAVVYCKVMGRKREV
ncbi:MAG: nucleoside recognition protein [Lachnospiraceae bacterium]|jgi:spore maturation protein A|nr:nucleoside recognition protein [Lachnospiraceae bacterium]